MEIYKHIQTIRYLIILILVLQASSCSNNSPNDDYSMFVLEGISFEKAQQVATQENKYLWVVLGSKENCGHTSNFLKALKTDGFFEKYHENFIFYSCNITDTLNEFYFYILSPESMPNSYIFNQKGEVISLNEAQKDIKNFTSMQAQSVVNNNPYNPNLHKDYSMGGIRLLNHINNIIKASNYISSKNNDTLNLAKKILNSVDSLNKNYFYYYLATQLAIKQNDTVLRNNNADLAYSLYSFDTNPLLFSSLNDKIKKFSATYKKEQLTAAEIYFEKQIINCEKIKLGKVKEYSISVKNNGTYPLVIYKAQVSCDCVEIKYPKHPIKPNEKSTVKFLYHANTKGVFIKNVYFHSNASNKIQKITLEGEVI